MAKEPATAQVAVERPVADARIHQQESCTGKNSFPPQVGPDLGLHYNHYLRLQPAKHAAHCEAKVEGREEHAIDQPGEFFQCYRPSRERCRRNVQRRKWKLFMQMPHQFLSRDHFADRNGVQPDGLRLRPMKGAVQPSEPLAEMAPVTAVAEAAK